MADLQPVGPLILNNISFLKKVCKTVSAKKRWKLLKNSNSDELLSLIEVCYNILRSNFCLTNKQKQKLVPHIDHIRKLGRTRTEKGARRLIQKGSGVFLPALLTPILVEVARYFLNKN